jgi:CRP-like cAMP-binding protein
VALKLTAKWGERQVFNLERIIPGSFLIYRDQECALLGCPPEILKYILKKGLPMPQTIVLPETFHAGGHSQIAIEFPFYHFLFIQQGLASGRRYRLIGTEKQCRQVADLLRVTLLGPDYDEMVAWGVKKSTAKMLRTEADYLAIKNPSHGNPFKLEEVIEFVHYKKNRASLFSKTDGTGSEIKVTRQGGNVFEITGEKLNEQVDLNFVGEQQPPFEIPLASTPDHPVPFGITVLGGATGFDVNAPTLGAMLWINGNVVLWDSPAWIKHHLRARGIATEMIRAVIVSHMHEDHCNFTELLMDGHRPTVITTREIYHCLLFKLAAIVGEDASVIADSMDWIPVEVGKPLSLFGATFDFFYSVHSIPTLGCRLTVKNRRGEEHTVLFSGDTVSTDVLGQMLQAGKIKRERHDQLKNLIHGDEEYVFMDGGGPPLHASPADFTEYDIQIYFNHLSKMPEGLEGYHGVMLPGMKLGVIDAEPLPPWYTMGILEVLQLLQLDDNRQISVIFSQGRVRTLSKGEIIVRQDSPGDLFYFILSGTLEVLKDGRHEATLEWGDFFGEIAIIKNTRRSATVRAVTPAVIFEIPGTVFLDVLKNNKLLPVFEKIWDRRDVVSHLEFFEGLDASAINKICLLMEEKQFESGEQIIQEGRNNAEFMVVKKGTIELKRNGGPLLDENGKPTVLDPGDYLGLKNSLNRRRRSRKSAFAKTKTSVLVLSGADLMSIQDRMPIVKHRLLLTLRKQGIKNATELLGPLNNHS